jgi:hypothetical protein
MKKIIVTPVLTAALLASSLLAAAPAAASGLVLPPNANGTDNSGITALLCDSALHMRLPLTQKSDPDFYMEKRYEDMKWEVSINGTEIFSAESYQSAWADDILISGVFDSSLVPNNAVTLTLEASATNPSVSNSFTMEVQKLDDTFSSGTGTRSNPYLIGTADELNAMRCHMNKYFELTSNIDLAGYDWLPIGSENDGWGESAVVNNWRGALDGNGFTIRNLELEGLNEFSGLFGDISHYAIRDLTLKNFDISGVGFIGAFAGRTSEGSMSNVKVVNSKVSGMRAVGLLAGLTEYESNFDKISTQGEVFATPRIKGAWPPGTLEYESMRLFGGVIGAEEGDGTVWTNTSADVKIQVLDDANRIEGKVLNEGSTIYIRNVGGITGEALEGFSFSRITAKAEIILGNDPLSPSESSRVGGAFGATNMGLVKHVVVDSKIYDEGYGKLDQIGGVFGAGQRSHLANVRSNTVLDLEVGYEDSADEENHVNRIGGAFGTTDGDSTIQYFQSNSDIKIVRLGGKLSRIGGFAGLEDDTQIYDVNSFAKLSIADANGTNNSEGIVLNDPQQEWFELGGFSGLRRDFLTHTSISAVSTITIQGAPVSSVGGYFGHQDDADGFSLRNGVVRGSITVPADSSNIGAFAGTSAALRLANVIVSTKLNLNGSTENVGSFVGESIEDGTTLSRFYNTYVNSGLGNPGDAPVDGRTAKQLRSTKFLQNNGFDLVNVFEHKDGSWPIIRMQFPIVNGEILRKGRTNNDTSISVSVVKKSGNRSFFVNMPNINARQTASLYVIRDGKKVKLIHTAVLNAVGNWYTTSNFEVRIGDILQVEIDDKKLRKLVVN